MQLAALVLALQAVTSAEPGPSSYHVAVETDRGTFIIEVQRAWAPVGADHFYSLVRSGFYDNCKVFRAVRRFMVQFGIAGAPSFGSLEREAILDDQPRQSNGYGTVSFAMSGPDSRTTQVFVSTRDNSYLDAMGFAPFGVVREGMRVVESLFTGYGEEPMQHNAEMQREGNAYLQRAFPRLSSILSARLVGPREGGGARATGNRGGAEGWYGGGGGDGVGGMGLPSSLQESNEKLNELWEDRQRGERTSSPLSQGLGRLMRFGLGGGPSQQKVLQASQIMEAQDGLYPVD